MAKNEHSIIEEDGFRLEGRMTAPEYYVDGWSQLLLGYPVTKVVFHTTVEPPNAEHKEFRRASATITMPLTVAIQLAQTILAACKGSESGISAAAEGTAAELKRILALQPSLNMPSGLTTTQPATGVDEAKPKL